MLIPRIASPVAVLLRVITVCALSLIVSPAAARIDITDLVGRSVQLDAPAKTIVLGDGRLLMAIALLDRDDPVKRVAALLSDLNVTDPVLLAQVQERFPAAHSLPIYKGSATSVSAEQIIQLAPDAAIFGLQDHGPGANNTELISQLEAAGIAVVFVDFRQDPLNNTLKSIDVLGKLLGREAEAREYATFYQARKKRIADRVALLNGPPPKVFVQAHVGRMTCCVGMANGMLGPFVTFAGGRNISAEVSPGPVGRHTHEFLIAENPDIWIGTASGRRADFDEGKPYIVLGRDIDAATAARSFQVAVETEKLQVLGALESGNGHAIWHNFYNCPLNIYALESFAKWIHPETFSDLDPDATLLEIYQRFLPFELTGTFSTGSRK